MLSNSTPPGASLCQKFERGLHFSENRGSVPTLSQRGRLCQLTGKISSLREDFIQTKKSFDPACESYKEAVSRIDEWKKKRVNAQNRHALVALEKKVFKCSQKYFQKCEAFLKAHRELLNNFKE